MQTRVLSETPNARRFLLVFETGDDVMPELERFAAAHAVRGAALAGIGGLQRATVGYFDNAAKSYIPIAIDEQVELLSFLGNVSMLDGKPKLHVHCTVGHRDGHSSGGHLLNATVRPTLELFVDECAAIERAERPDVGIPLISMPRT